MALQNLNLNQLSNLVVHEAEPGEGYARRDILVTGGGATLKMGQLVARTIASGSLDQTAAYAPVGWSNDNDLVATNEFAVVFGDKYSAKDSFVTESVGNTKAVAFVRGEVQLKQGTVKSANGASDAQMKKVKALLEKQGIVMINQVDALSTLI